MEKTTISPALEHKFLNLPQSDRERISTYVFNELFLGMKQREMTETQRRMTDLFLYEAKRMFGSSAEDSVQVNQQLPDADLRDEHGNLIKLDADGFPIFLMPEIPREYFVDAVKRSPGMFYVHASGISGVVTEDEIGEWYTYMTYTANWKYKNGIPVTKRNFRSSLIKQAKISREAAAHENRLLRLELDCDIPEGRGFEREVLGRLCRALNKKRPGTVRQEEAEEFWGHLIMFDFIGEDRKVIVPSSLVFYLGKFIREYRKECGYSKWPEWRKRGYADQDHMNEVISNAHIARCNGEITDEEYARIEGRFLNDADH